MNLRELEMASKEFESLIKHQNEYNSFNTMTYKQMFKQIEVFVESYLDDKYIKQQIRTMNVTLMNGSELAYKEKRQELINIIIQKVDAEIKKLTIPSSIDVQSNRYHVETDQPIKETKEKENKVFIIHGHDGELKEKVARVIEKQGIEAVILSEGSRRGKLILEKFFDEISKCKAAVVLYSPDDKTGETYQARPNVIFEHGYAIAALGRENVIMINNSREEELSLHSDINGLLYIDAKTEFKYELLRELKDIGFDIDMNK